MRFQDGSACSTREWRQRLRWLDDSESEEEELLEVVVVGGHPGVLNEAEDWSRYLFAKIDPLHMIMEDSNTRRYFRILNRA
jgi:hypothetical protein